MVQTRKYKTKEEAIEAWNSWPGRLYNTSQDDYNRLNDSVERDYPVDNGKLQLPDGENAFGDIVISEDSGFESPWPRIYWSDFALCENGVLQDDIVTVYKTRARWRLINKNNPELKQEIVELLKNNDRDNRAISSKLKNWNGILAESGFPLFEENDLRGVDLSGQTIAREDGNQVFLRGMNLCYSECHLLKFQNVNLYGAKLEGIKAIQLDIAQSTCCQASFRGSLLSRSQFLCSDLAFTDFRNSLLFNSNLDGANCQEADFSASSLLKASFGNYTPPSEQKAIYSDLTGCKWDSKTRFGEVDFNQFLNEQNVELYKHIEKLRREFSMKKELASSLEVKPSLFGISIDIKKVIGSIRELFSRKKS